MRTSSTLLEKVEQYFRRLDLPVEGLVVAVSGGPDSVALARALLALAPSVPLDRLVLAHLNHRLRGPESDADAAFVESLFRDLGSTATRNLQVRIERLDVAFQARAEGGNLESVARRLRYGWLAEIARQERLPLVATGHTAADQAETVLHRLLRGTGLKGLRGIAPRRSMGPGVEVVRPLLSVTRTEVLAYLEAEGQAFRQDSSNQDLRFTRNRIRHELLPLLASSYNPAIQSVLCRLAENAEEVYRWQEAAVRTFLKEAELPRAGSLVVLDRQRLAAAPRHLVREILRLIWEREGWPLARMSFPVWDRLAGLALGESVALDLPGGIRARCQGRVVQVGQDS